ncbi:MAG TPA: DoxX family protein [Bryobacteraceae bacterium]|nr:DoxX family protein [Bryobacteraceae bacterium]
MRWLWNTENWVVPSILRVTLGIVMFPHGAQKLLGWFGGYGFTGTMNYFTQSQGIPAVFAMLAIATEFFGALGLIAGLLTRVAAFGIFSVMCVAIAMVHANNGFFMNWTGKQAGEGFEYHLLAIGIAIVLIIEGGGRWSVDRVLTAKRPG